MTTPIPTLDDFFAQAISSFIGGFIAILIMKNISKIGKVIGGKVEGNKNQFKILLISIILLFGLKARSSFALSWATFGAASSIVVLLLIVVIPIYISRKSSDET